MSIYNGLFVVAVAVFLTDVSAISKEDKEGIKDAILPFLVECAKEYDISMETLKGAKEAKSSDGLDPCFIGCFFKKIEMIDGSGKFDVETSKKHNRKYLHDEADIKKSDEIAEDCASVNDAEVSDGDKGCERAKLLADCLAEHRQEEYLP